MKFLKYVGIAIGSVFALFFVGAFSIAMYKAITEPRIEESWKPNPKADEEQRQAVARLKQMDADRQAEKAKDMEEEVFAPGLGRCYSLEQYVQDRMNNPSSFEHVRTTHATYPDHYTVILKYRGTNKFGAVVTEAVQADLDLKGNVISILQL